MKFLLAAILTLLLSSSALAAVAVGLSDVVFGIEVDTISMTFAVTGSNTLALCGTGNQQDTAVPTFNAVPMDLVTQQNPFANYYYSLWKMVGVSGTHDFEVVLSDTGFFSLGCTTFTGVDPTTPIGTFATATGPSNITLTVPANGMAADFAGDHPGDCSAGLTAGAGQTVLYADCMTGASNVSARGSYRTTSGDFLWESYWIQIGVPINPVAAAVSNRRRAIAVQ